MRVLDLKDDKYLIAGIIGAISTLPIEIVAQILVKLGYATYSNFNLSSLLVTGNKPSLIMGLFVSSTVGGFISVLLYHVFIKIGSEHLIIKCIATSISMWIALEFVIKIIFEGKLIPIRPMSASYSHLFSAIIYGISQGILFNYFLFYKGIEHIEHNDYTPKQIDNAIEMLKNNSYKEVEEVTGISKSTLIREEVMKRKECEDGIK